jgi:thioredoxin reductase (NADPH)
MYEVAIIGAGPAGLSAAIQAKRYKINAITIADELGGKITNAHSIENWPGDFAINGNDLSDKIINHSKQIEANVVVDKVKFIKKVNDYFLITADNEQYKAYRIIFAVGNEKAKLNIEGEEEFLKKGVSYQANKEGVLFKNKTVAVVGSGDSACTSALFLADIADKVYLMYRSKNLKAEPIWVDKVKNNKKIELLAGVMPKKILGNETVKQIVCNDERILNVDGVFIEIGFNPSSDLAKDLELKTDADGFVLVDDKQQTSAKNVWAAGDITTNSDKLRQIITAASEGMVALNDVYDNINNGNNYN